MASRRTAHRRQIADSAVRTLTYMTFGLLVWAAHLTLVYGAHTLICARGGEDSLLFGAPLGRVAVVLATVAALALLTWFVIRRGRRSRSGGDTTSFSDRVAVALAWLGFFGVAAEGATALFVTACAALR